MCTVISPISKSSNVGNIAYLFMKQEKAECILPILVRFSFPFLSVCLYSLPAMKRVLDNFALFLSYLFVNKLGELRADII